MRGGPPTGEAAASLFRQRRYFALTLVAPAALILLLFQVLPILMGVDASLRRFSLTDEEHPFIGLRNFKRVLSDAQFLGVVLPNTFFFMFASVAGGVWHCSTGDRRLPCILESMSIFSSFSSNKSLSSRTSPSSTRTRSSSDSV